MIRTGMISTIDRDNSELSSLCNAWILYWRQASTRTISTTRIPMIFNSIQVCSLIQYELRHCCIGQFQRSCLVWCAPHLKMFLSFPKVALSVCFYIDDLQRVGEYIRAFCQAAHFPGHPISSGTIPPDCYRPSSLLFIGIENFLVRCCYVDELKRLVVTTIERQGELMYIGGAISLQSRSDM